MAHFEPKQQHSLHIVHRSFCFAYARKNILAPKELASNWNYKSSLLRQLTDEQGEFCPKAMGSNYIRSIEYHKHIGDQIGKTEQ